MHGKIRHPSFDSSNIGINTDANMNHNTSVKVGSLKQNIANIKQFEKKDNLLSYAFDHIYACNEGNVKNNTENTHMNSDQSEVNNAVENKERSSAFSRLNDNFNNSISEVRHLKDLLLLHLDLIQQQSEQLLSKDKLISTLKQENDLLKSKLNRTDRRVYSKRNNLNGINTRCQSPEQLQSQSPVEVFLSNGYCNNSQESNSLEKSLTVFSPINSDNTHSNNQISLEKSKDKTNKSRVIKSNGVNDSVESSVIGENGGNLINKIILHKINTNYELSLNNGLNYESNVEQTNGGLGLEKRTEDLLSPVNVKTEDKSFCEEGISLDSSSSKAKKRNIENNTILGSFGSELLNHHEPKRRIRELLMTSKEYHIAIGDVEFGSEEQEDVSIKDQSSILEVPRWCGQTYTSSNSVEGIENLDDSIIAKRHMKWEIEEKRRKRWDVQRIREQRTIERLKSRQSRSGNTRLSVGGAMSGSSSGIFGSAGGRLSPNGEEDVGCQAPESLWPDPHDARFIVLTEQLPVCALGANLPLLQPREFSLPWSTRSTARSPGGTESRRSSQTANRHRRQRRQRIKSRTKSLA